MKDIARKKQEMYKKRKEQNEYEKKKQKKEKEIWKEKGKKKDLCFKVTLPARDGEKIKILQNCQNI